MAGLRQGKGFYWGDVSQETRLSLRIHLLSQKDGRQGVLKVARNVAACTEGEPVALLVGAFPLACVWPCEAACSWEDGEVRGSTFECPWLSASGVSDGFWCQEVKELDSGEFSFLISCGNQFSCNKTLKDT